MNNKTIKVEQINKDGRKWWQIFSLEDETKPGTKSQLFGSQGFFFGIRKKQSSKFGPQGPFAANTKY